MYIMWYADELFPFSVELLHVIEQARLSPQSRDLLVITPSQSQDIVRGSADGGLGSGLSEECICILISINPSESRCECVRQTPAVTNEYICMGMTVSP